MEIPSIPLSKYIQACDELSVIHDQAESQNYIETLWNDEPIHNLNRSAYLFTRKHEYIRDIKISEMKNVKSVELNAGGLVLWIENDCSDNETLLCPQFVGMKLYPIRYLIYTPTRIIAFPKDETKPCSFTVGWNWIIPITNLKIEDLIIHSITYDDLGTIKVKYGDGHVSDILNFNFVVKRWTTTLDWYLFYNQFHKKEWFETMTKVLNNTSFPLLNE